MPTTLEAPIKRYTADEYFELEKSDFNNFSDLKAIYGNASIIGDNRIIFNVLGNKYRLIVRVSFQYKRMMIKWFGTHEEYDRNGEP